MNVTDTEIQYGETVTVGRKGCGWGVDGQLVTILGEEFVRIGGKLFEGCGNCDSGYSGTKSHYAGILGGVCFQCGGKGVTKKYDSIDDLVKTVKRRASRRASAARKAAEKAAAAEKLGADWRAANPDVAALGEAIYAEMSEAGYEGHQAVDDRWGGRVTHLANLVGMGRALTDAETAELPEAVAKALDEQAAEQARQDAQRYLGTVGDSVTVTGTVKANKSIETRYGWTRLLIVEGTGEFTGVTIKAWGNSKPVREAERGDAVTITGTVKDHDEYDGTKQTELARAKVTR